MAEISRFYGIMIKMYFDDHNPPHFHAQYSGDEVRIDINTLAVISGRLPARALGLVAEWASLHQEELLVDGATRSGGCGAGIAGYAPRRCPGRR